MADDPTGRGVADDSVGTLRRLARRGWDWLTAIRRGPTYPTPPRRFEDDEGRTVDLRAYDDGAFERLVEMYVDFDPAQRAQGTPPIGEPAVRDWLTDVVEGPGVVAAHGDRTVGHVLFAPDGTGRHELAVFVHQEYQRAGIGSALLETGLGHARDSGIGYVWLTVEQHKRGVQKLYSDVGFSTVNPMGATHRMSLSLSPPRE